MNRSQSKYKKELGYWGERCLDSWMKSQNWDVFHQNLLIRGGEIDRVYVNQMSVDQKKRFCIAEIKTAFIYRKKEFQDVFSEVGFKRYLKQRQMQNLYRFAETLQSRGPKGKKSSCLMWIRFFLILRLKDKNIVSNEILKTNQSGLKLCHKNADYLIFSVEPEFTVFRSRKSLLQTCV